MPCALSIGNSSRRTGFTIIELLVSMSIMLMVLGATMATLSNAFKSNETARAIIDLNNNLRIGADLMVRDLLQVGQGLPTGRLVQVPNGTGALRIQRPRPDGSACTQWPEGITAISAVSVGPGCGPTIDGALTDIITTIAVDSALEGVPVYAFDITGHRATLALPAQATGGVDISNGTSDDVRVGDLIMFTKGSASTLVYVTAVDGTQTIAFATGDPMNLNQFASALNGTVDDLAALAPTGANTAVASRVRMVTYYLDTTIDPTTPRLMRHANWGDPSVVLNQRARTVAFAVNNLQLTYDMVDGVANPSGVRMVDADLTTSGACSPNACSPNQIRKVNVFLSGRSQTVHSVTKKFFRNALNTQVSLRSLALVDRYQ
jgi:prepilin-type N-terminal cleavage/methylation domain-containing protein